MQPVFNLINPFAYIDLPKDLVGWLGWLVVFIILVWSIKNWWEPLEIKNIRRWTLFLILIVLVPITTIFLGIRLPKETALPLPGLPTETRAPIVMLLSALPWVLAAGILGPLPALLLGAMSGFILAYWETHTLFTPLEVALLALLFSAAIRQRYRTLFYRFLRHPMGAAIVLISAYVPVYIFSSFFVVNKSLAVRIDYALTQIWFMVFARWSELLVASLVAEIIYLARLKFWGRVGDLQPSPAESSLQVRFFNGTFPLVIVLVLALTIGDWIVAGNVARLLVSEELSGIARIVAESLPYFLASGQSLILDLADNQLLTLPADQRDKLLEDGLRKVPYFNKLLLYDANGNLVSAFPKVGGQNEVLTKEEDTGKQQAINGVPVQFYVSAIPGSNTALVSFIAAIRDDQDRVTGVLVGRTDFDTNLFTAPVIHALDDLKNKETGSEGFIIDETRHVLYPSTSTSYLGRIPENAEFFDDTSPTGTRQLVYYQPVVDQTGTPILNWAVILTVPAERAQQLALSIAIPLMIILVALSALAFLFLRISLKWVTSSVQTLAGEAALFSQGHLDHGLQINGVDEIGQLGHAFEKMRMSLKDRLDELNHLLVVSQGVAAHLDAADAVKPVLNAALDDGVSMVRVVLRSDVGLQSQPGSTISFGLGPAVDTYTYLDDQIYEKMSTQDLLPIPNVARMRRLVFSDDKPRPGALFALALRHESEYYGALWVAYDQTRDFTDEQVRFLSTLAGQAALAAANARLYATAEIGRQRLDAVLASTPEPVLVFDNEMRLLLLNLATLQTPGMVSSSQVGSRAQEIITHPDLLDLILSAKDILSSREIMLGNNRIYYASVAPVMAKQQPVGKICILRDITHYKELDTLKSDFVATVSHDLRSPLTLMSGYATMLKMVGNLNDQQNTYADKILTSVEGMSRLVNNLLDLGRVEAGIGLQIEDVNVVDIVNQVITSLQPQAVQKRIRLVEEFVPSMPVKVEADSVLLKQALYNLIENGIKYTPMEGQVKINLQVEAALVTICVQDTGIGIAPLDLPHMFEKFYRSGRREAYSQRGTGLGLAIVKSIVERHNGRVWVDSQLGKGSAFFIEIPFQQQKLA